MTKAIYQHSIQEVSAEMRSTHGCRKVSVRVEEEVGTLPRPPIVYTYLKAKYAVSDILGMHLKASEADKTNDCFEYAWKIVSILSDPDGSLRRQRIEQQIRFQKEYAEGIKFISCSDSAENPLLWAHYADVNKGVCLGLSVNLKIEGEDVVRQVFYDGPVEISVDRNRSDTEDYALLDRVLRTKEKEWEGEREWRLVFPASFERVETGADGRKYFKIQHEEIREVVFGLHCSPEDIGLVCLACLRQKLEIPFFRIDIDHENHRFRKVEMKEATRNNYIGLALLSESRSSK